MPRQRMKERLIPLSNGRTVALDYETDASTLQWILTHNILPSYGADYEYLRRIIRRRFNMKVEEFLQRQTFPETDFPLFNAREFIDSLPPEAFDSQLWAHPVIYVIHDWVDSGLVLKPRVPDRWCRSDFEAAIYIIRKKLKNLYEHVDTWIAINFNITRDAFIELFIRTRVMHSDNAYSRMGKSPGIIRRYRKDIASLIDRGDAWAHKAKLQIKDYTRRAGETLRDINRVNRAIDQIAEIVNSPELKELVEEGERITEEWETLRATQALRAQKKTKKN